MLKQFVTWVLTFFSMCYWFNAYWFLGWGNIEFILFNIGLFLQNMEETCFKAPWKTYIFIYIYIYLCCWFHLVYDYVGGGKWPERCTSACTNINGLKNILRPRQNGCHFPDIFKCIFLNENVWIWNKISMKFISKDPMNSILALVQIMAWRWPGGKPLSEPVVVRLNPQPQWNNQLGR